MKDAFSKKRKGSAGTSTITTDEGELLSVLQLSDSFFPIGGYSLSFGLETFSQMGMLKKKQDVASLLSIFVEQLASSDAVALRAAHRAARKEDIEFVSRLDRRLASFKNVKEFYEASLRAGRALLRTVESFAPSSSLVREYRRVVEKGGAPGMYPVCLGIVCQSLGIKEDEAVALLAYTLSVSILGAAIRLGDINHLEAQEILHSKKKSIREALARSSRTSWRNMRAFAPILDIMGMQHVYLSSRMFSC